MTERTTGDLSLAAALLAAGATLARTEADKRGRLLFVLAGDGLADLERAHFAGTLTVTSRAYADHRHGLSRLIRLNREGGGAGDGAADRDHDHRRLRPHHRLLPERGGDARGGEGAAVEDVVAEEERTA